MHERARQFVRETKSTRCNQRFGSLRTCRWRIHELRLPLHTYDSYDTLLCGAFNYKEPLDVDVKR